jgi:hypothetical protein
MHPLLMWQQRTQENSSFPVVWKRSKWRRKLSAALQRKTVRYIIFGAARVPDGPPAAPTVQPEFLIIPGLLPGFMCHTVNKYSKVNVN